MKCHYVHDKLAGKVLIPGCWGTVHYGEMDDCNCPEYPHLAYIEYLKREGKTKEAKEYMKIYIENKGCTG